MSDRDLFLAYGALMTGAVVPIYFGSLSSLKTPASTRALRKRSGKNTSADSESEDEPPLSETLTSSDAWLFPVFGSAVLFGMYLVFRYLDKEYVNMLLSAYFGVVGVLAVAKVSVAIARGLAGPSLWNQMEKYKVCMTKGPKELFIVRFTAAHLPLVAVSTILVAYYVATRHWLASNALALSLSVNAVALMGLDSFRTGAIMLGGLFAYDIFWVFGTDVMVSVARNFDAPIKILWPKNLIEGVTLLSEGKPAPKWQFTMLGLGDIVIPGIFIALALRFDQTRAAARSPSANFTRHYTSFPKPYFYAVLVAYVAGLATTMGVMHIFRAAQPALLYLSPACTGALALTALARGEWAEVWGWTDEDEEAKEKRLKEEAEEAKKSSSAKAKKGASNKAIRNGDSLVVPETRETDEEEIMSEELASTPKTRKRRSSRKTK